MLNQKINLEFIIILIILFGILFYILKTEYKVEHFCKSKDKHCLKKQTTIVPIGNGKYIYGWDNDAGFGSPVDATYDNRPEKKLQTGCWVNETTNNDCAVYTSNKDPEANDAKFTNFANYYKCPDGKVGEGCIGYFNNYYIRDNEVVDSFKSYKDMGYTCDVNIAGKNYQSTVPVKYQDGVLSCASGDGVTCLKRANYADCIKKLDLVPSVNLSKYDATKCKTVFEESVPIIPSTKTQNPNLIVNSDFESNKIANNTSGTTVTGWVLTGSCYLLNNNTGWGYPIPLGFGQFVTIQKTGSLSQANISLSASKTYLLTFFICGRPWSKPQKKWGNVIKLVVRKDGTTDDSNIVYTRTIETPVPYEWREQLHLVNITKTDKYKLELIGLSTNDDLSAAVDNFYFGEIENLIKNGDFEVNQLPANSSSSTVNNWTITGAAYLLNTSTAWGYPVYLNKNQIITIQKTGSISQSGIKLTAGKSYILSFYSCIRPWSKYVNPLNITLTGPDSSKDTIIINSNFQALSTAGFGESIFRNITVSKNGSYTLTFTGKEATKDLSIAIDFVCLIEDKVKSNAKNFIYYPAENSPGNDIRSYQINSVDVCRNDCANDPNCSAFVTNGSQCWIKNSNAFPNQPLVYDSVFDTYVKSYGNYQAYLRWNSPENDLTPKLYINPVECANKCASDKNCNVFVTDAGGTSCWIKNKPSDTFPFTKSAVSTKCSGRAFDGSPIGCTTTGRSFDPRIDGNYNMYVKYGETTCEGIERPILINSKFPDGTINKIDKLKNVINSDYSNTNNTYKISCPKGKTGPACTEIYNNLTNTESGTLKTFGELGYTCNSTIKSGFVLGKQDPKNMFYFGPTYDKDKNLILDACSERINYHPVTTVSDFICDTYTKSSPVDMYDFANQATTNISINSTNPYYISNPKDVKGISSTTVVESNKSGSLSISGEQQNKVNSENLSNNYCYQAFKEFNLFPSTNPLAVKNKNLNQDLQTSITDSTKLNNLYLAYSSAFNDPNLSYTNVDNIKKGVNEVLKQYPLKAYCCNRRQPTDSIKLRVPIDPTQNYAGSTIDVNKFGFDFRNIPATTPDGKDVCPTNLSRYSTDCDTFMKFYCETVADVMTKQGLDVNKDLAQYAPECQCYAPNTPANSGFVNIPSVCYKPGCDSGTTTYLDPGSRESDGNAKVCSVQVCNQVLNVQGNTAGGGVNVDGNFNNNCSQNTSSGQTTNNDTTNNTTNNNTTNNTTNNTGATGSGSSSGSTTTGTKSTTPTSAYTDTNTKPPPNSDNVSSSESTDNSGMIIGIVVVVSLFLVSSVVMISMSGKKPSDTKNN
jgi:hypothetical protein